MANISYNGNYTTNGILTFTGVPNILKVEDTASGSKAVFNFTFNGNLRNTVTADTQYYVTFLGETVTNVITPSDAVNKRFYISGNEESTAYSFARALRNCSGISAIFNIICSGSTVSLVSKTIGQIWSATPNYLQRNIPLEYLSTYGTDGNSYSVYFNSKIDVDIYAGDMEDKDNYVTTLEKNFYGEECAFDVSPVLATFSEFGKTKPYTFSLNLFRADGEWQSIGTVSGYTTIGYLANGSDKYISTDALRLLVNQKRDTDGITLYTYTNTIPLSVMRAENDGGYTLDITALDSTGAEIYNTKINHRTGGDGSNLIHDFNISIPVNIFSSTYTIVISMNNEKATYEVIKPLKATEYYQRVYWRNEYGGISFFDFTGSRSESDSVDIETYEKNVFDYYTIPEFEKKKIYKNNYSKRVTLKSHLMKKSGKWIFNSLMRSKSVWTEVNNKTYYIIPQSISVDEDQQYNNIYTATLNYEYSDIS